MAIAHPNLTTQGQISVPARIRKKLGLRPGSVLEWDDGGDQVVVRKTGRYPSADVHAALFGTSAAPKGDASVKEGIRAHVRRRHARD